MATLIKLVEAGAIVRVDPQLGLKEYEARRIFILPNVKTWLPTRLPELGSTWQVEVSPAEQLDALVYEFCVGEPLDVGRRFKALVHLADGIWELKTADLRLFGWFPFKDCFIVTDCDQKERIMRLNAYRSYSEQAARKRNSLELDEPKFIPGENPDDVVQIPVSPSRRAAARFVSRVRRTLQRAVVEEGEQQGINQSKIADAIGVHRSVISRELNGRQDITLGRVAELAWALGREIEFELVAPTSEVGQNAPVTRSGRFPIDWFAMHSQYAQGVSGGVKTENRLPPMSVRTFDLGGAV